MARALLVVGVVLVTTLVLGVMLMQQSAAPRPVEDGDDAADSTPGTGSLVFYCAAGIRNPVVEAAKQYENEFGTRIDLQFGGSGTLLSQLRLAEKGDLYLAADSSYIDIAREQGLVAEAIPLANMRMVIGVAKGNPKGIRTIDDLLRDDVRLALANPDAASVGKQTQLLLEQQGQWSAIESAVQTRGVFKPTVNEIATDVKLGTADAAIIWDATANQPTYKPALDVVALPGGDTFVKQVTVSILKTSEQPTEALRFARYLAARDKGLPMFERFGFEILAGDAWARTPELTFFSGSVNRPAIEETIKAFEQREGVRVLTVYNGCGILNGQIKLGDRPDAYQTCDITFMEGVTEHFTPAVSVSQMDLIIVTREGNPRGIQGVADLAQADLRIGLAHERQSALGALTGKLLKQMGHYDSIQPNVVTQTPTGDLLVAQMVAGNLDAVLVYRANATNVQDQLELIAIDHPAAHATQTIAAGTHSKYPQLVARLTEAIKSAESAERFQQAGFKWIFKPSGAGQ